MGSKDRIHWQSNSQKSAQFQYWDGTTEKPEPAHVFEDDNHCSRIVQTLVDVNSAFTLIDPAQLKEKGFECNGDVTSTTSTTRGSMMTCDAEPLQILAYCPTSEA